MEGTTLVGAQRAEPSIVRKNNHEAAKKLIAVSNPGEEKKNKDVITKLDRHAINNIVAFLSLTDGVYFLSSNKKLAKGIAGEKEYVEEKATDVFKMLRFIYCGNGFDEENSLERIYAGFVKFAKNYLFFSRENNSCPVDIARKDIDKHQSAIVKSGLFLAEKKVQQGVVLNPDLLSSSEKENNKNLFTQLVVALNSNKYGNLLYKRGWQKLFSFFVERLFPNSYLMLIEAVDGIEKDRPIPYAQYNDISFDKLETIMTLSYFAKSVAFLGLNADGRWLYKALKQDKLAMIGLWRAAGTDASKALFFYSRHGDLHAVKALLALGADKDKTQNNRATPLYIAARSGHLATIEALLEAGADEDRADWLGETPLCAAARNGHSDVVQVLLEKGADKDKANHEGETPLLAAARSGHLAIVRRLLEADADKDKAKNEGATPLFIAAKKGYLNIVKALLAAGADQDKTDNSGATPLHISLQQGHLNIVQALLAAGADKDKARDDGVTPLLVASYNGHLTIVQALLVAGADKDKSKNNGVTPLYIAAEKGHLEIVEALLKAGADKDKAGNRGETPLYMASYKGHLDVVKALLEAGADKDKASGWATPLGVASCFGHLIIVQALLKAGADKDKADYNEWTPLFMAAQQGYLNIVQALLQAGADKDTASNDGRTPLYIATQEGHLNIVQVLIEAGVDKDKAASNGRTPLYVASQQGDLNIVNVLIEAGADINKAANNEKTPLSIAQENGHTAIVNALLAAGANKDMTASYVCFAILSITAVTVVACLCLSYLPLVLAPLLGGALGYVGASLAQKININTIDTNTDSSAVNNQQKPSLLLPIVLGGLLGLGVGAMLCFAGLPLAAMVAVSLVASVGVLCAPMAAKLCGCNGQPNTYTQVNENESSCGVGATR